MASREVLPVVPTQEGYGFRRVVNIGKSRRRGEVYYFVRLREKGRVSVLHRAYGSGAEEECRAFIDRGLECAPKTAPKKKKRKAAAKK